MFFKLATIATSILILSGCGGDTPKIESDTGTNIPIITDTQQDVIKVHNEKRNIYFTDSPLTYSIDLEKEAQIYANTLANSGDFEHDTENNHAKNYGENLYASSENRPLTIYDAMPHWFDEEEPHYHYDDGSCDTPMWSLYTSDLARYTKGWVCNSSIQERRFQKWICICV